MAAMEAFGDRVRSCLQAEDVDSTVVEYLASVARDVYEGSMSIDELTDLVLMMIPESSLSLAGRDVVAKSFCDILDEAANSTCRSETQSENNQSGAVGNGSDPEWLSELLLRTRVTATAEATTQSAEGKQNSHDLDVLSEVTGSCLDQDYLEHVLQQAGGNVQTAACWLVEQKDLGRLQSEWQAATRKNHDAIKQDNAIQIQESTNLKKAIVKQFAFVEEKKRGVHGGAAMPWGHTKAASTANPPQVRYRDGMKVPSRGEKHIIISQPEWDGGSRGKVYTKGKRGKGFS